MRKILLVVAATVATLAITTAAASAGYTELGYFGYNPVTRVTAGGVGSADGQLDDPGAADVRSSTGKLYVADTLNNRVQVFTPTAQAGTFAGKVAVPAPTGVAVDQASGDVYVSNASGVLKFDEDLDPITSGWTAPADTGTLAVDPGTGDLLIADLDDNLIRRYSSDGTAGDTFVAARPMDLAVDSTGDVIVVTSTGDVINDCGATSAVERFSSGGTFEGTIGALSAPGTVAVDPDDDSVVVAARVNQYACGADAPFVALFGADGTPGPVVPMAVEPVATYNVVPGLAAVGAGSSRIYAVTKSPAHDSFSYTKIEVIQDVNPPEVTIDPVDAGSVTATEATFTGTVDPNGVATQFHFEYRIVGTAGWTSSPDQDAGSGPDPTTTGNIAVTGLRPNSDYEVRLVAGSDDGNTTSDPETFTTDTAPPAAETRLALGISATGARLNGRIDPQGLATTYWVEYGATTAYGASRPAAQDADAGDGHGEVSVGQVVSDLQPETLYHFRIVAKNAAGTTQGGDHTFTTTAVPRPSADTCQNAPIRAAQNAAWLPSCRVYEMVSSGGKNGADVLIWNGTIRAATDGRSVAFSSIGAFAGPSGSPLSVQYRSSRNDGGWTTNAIAAPQLPNEAYRFTSTGYRGYTDDLTKGFVEVYPDDGLLDPVAPQGVRNLYARSLPGGSFQVLSAPEPGTLAPSPSPNTGVSFLAASDDGSHVIFESTSNLTSDATGPLNPKLYESIDGDVRLVGILPAGEGGGPAPGGSIAAIGTGGSNLVQSYADRAISRDGSRVFFVANPDFNKFGQIYVRENGNSTVRVSAPEPDAPQGATQPAHYWTATPDGRYVFFTSSQKLTADSTAEPTAAGSPIGQPDLYRFDVQTGDLVDISRSLTDTPAAVAGLGQAEGGGMVGISDDGSRAYFVAAGQIVADAPATTEPKMYSWQDGQGVTYIATLHRESQNGALDTDNWYQGGRLGRTKQSRVTPDGRHVLFVSVNKLDPDRDNGGHLAAYLYSADPGSIDCISCPGDGSAASADATLGSASAVSGRLTSNTAGEGAAGTMYLPRFLSDDGKRAFFMTSGSLTSQDINGVDDVYMWQDGQASLVSTGRSLDRSFFGDATPSGDDVLIGTRERLSRWDTDNNLDVYNVRVEGGVPEPRMPGEPCAVDGDACQGPGARATDTSVDTSNPGGQDSPTRVAATLSLNPVSASRRARFAATGKIVLTVRSSDAGTVKASATAVVAQRSTTVASARRTVSAGGTSTLTLTLSRAARAQLASAGKLSVKITVDHSLVPAAKTVTLKLTRRAGLTVSAPKKTVNGSSAALSVRVAGKGRIVVSGSGVKGVRRTAGKAGSYRLSVGLTAKAKHTVTTKKTLRVKAKVTFTPAGGRAQTRTVSLTFKQATASRRAMSAALTAGLEWKGGR